MKCRSMTGVFDRLIEIPTRSGCYILAEELILHFLPLVFAKYKVAEKSLIRITRNADIDADSIYDEDLDSDIVNRLRGILELERDQVYSSLSPLDLSFLFSIQDILRGQPQLFYEKRVPQYSPAIDSDKMTLYRLASHSKVVEALVEAAENGKQVIHYPDRHRKL